MNNYSPYWMFVGRKLDYIYPKQTARIAVEKQLGLKDGQTRIYFKYKGIYAKLRYGLHNYQDQRSRKYQDKIDTTVITYEIENDSYDFKQCVKEEKQKIKYERLKSGNNTLKLD